MSDGRSSLTENKDDNDAAGHKVLSVLWVTASEFAAFLHALAAILSHNSIREVAPGFGEAGVYAMSDSC